MTTGGNKVSKTIVEALGLSKQIFINLEGLKVEQKKKMTYVIQATSSGFNGSNLARITINDERV